MVTSPFAPRAALAFIVAAFAWLTLMPSAGVAATRCSGNVSSDGFWRDLRTEQVSCDRARSVARSWIGRYYPGISRGVRPSNPQHVRGWRCTLKIIGTGEFQYGRVACTRSHASFTFRGYS